MSSLFYSSLLSTSAPSRQESQTSTILLPQKRPPHWYLPLADSPQGGGKTGSIATRATFQSKAGITFPNTAPSTSMQGLELAQIRKGFNLSSSMKSNPKSQKQYSRLLGLSLLAVDLMRSVAMPFILSKTSLKGHSGQAYGVLCKYFSNQLYETLLQFQNLPYSSPFFWTASLVRWTNLFSRCFRVNSLLAVRMQPYSYQYPFSTPLTVVMRMQQRMSNFLLLQRKGLSMYFWIIMVRFEEHLCVIKALMSLREERTVMPLPLFEFQPGLQIQILLPPFLP